MNPNRVMAKLREEEGEVLHAYQDHLGFWTIGVGRLIDKRKNGGISKEESTVLLQNDVTRVWNKLCDEIPWIMELNEPRQGALVLMAFQLGIEGLLKFKTSLSHIRMGNWQRAHDNMLLSLWAQQTPARAGRVAKQILTGEWQ